MKTILTLIGLMLFFNGECALKIWTGLHSSNYLDDYNWSPNGIPSSTDTLIINQHSANSCIISSDLIISGIVIENTTLFFENYSIVSSNHIEIKNSTVNGETLILSEGNCIIKNSIIRCKLNLMLNDLFIKGNNFFNKCEFKYVGLKNEYISGHNKYYKSLRIINDSHYRLRCSSSTGSVFLDSVFFINQSLGRLEASFRGLNIYKSQISLLSTNGDGVRFGVGNGLSKLDSIASLRADSISYNHGNLILKHIIQFNANLNSISCKNEVKFSSYNCDFNGKTRITSSSIYLRDNIFRKVAEINKTGQSSSYSYGNNLFNDSCIFTQKSHGLFRLSNVEGNIYKGPAEFIRKEGYNSLQVAYSDTSYFYNNLNFNSWNYMNIGLNSGVLMLEKDSIEIFSNQELRIYSIIVKNHLSFVKVLSDLKFNHDSSRFNIENSIIDFENNKLFFSRCSINKGLNKQTGFLRNLNYIKWLLNDSLQQSAIPLEETVTIEYINPSVSYFSINFHETDDNIITNSHYSESWSNINEEMYELFWEINYDPATSINFEIQINVDANYEFNIWNPEQAYWENSNVQQTLNTIDNKFKVFNLTNNPILSLSNRESVLDIDLILFESWCEDELIYINYIFNSSPESDYYLSTSLDTKDVFHRINQTNNLYNDDQFSIPKNLLKSELIYILEIKEDLVTDYRFTINCGMYLDSQILFHSNRLIINSSYESILSIYDLNARKVYQEIVKQNLINLSHLASGIYILKLHNQQFQSIEFLKIIIQ